MSDTSEPGKEPTKAADASDISESREAVMVAEEVVEAEKDAEEVVLAKPVAPQRKPSAVPLVLGGVIAAAIGFGVAQVVPEGWPLAKMTELEADLQAQAAAVAALTAQMGELAKAPAPDTTLADRVAAVEAAVEAAAPPVDVTALLARLDALEKKVAGLGTVSGGVAAPDAAALAQLQAEIDALKAGGGALDAKLAEAGSQLESLKTEAQAVVAQAVGRAALNQLQAAMDSGAPYGAALADLEGNDVPEVLKANAQGGLPSIQALRAQFPDAARAALDASLRVTSSDSWGERLSVFLRGQTGARSLTPREGTDPDAVLSRAEAAVAAGDVGQALVELEGLPDAGKAAMAGWLALANQRQQAVAAVQALTVSLGQ